jgi:ABC-type polysaccharide/polyol phosphate transport system ATPase subunit
MSKIQSKPVISVQNVTKKFAHWDSQHDSLKSILVDLVKGNLKLGKKKEFIALEDIHFDVHQGEFVGIMGRNGAGKSTLMKIISGIYCPTSGSVKVNGAIAPLIELGAGFSGDLSGYENIFLNAAILGFGKAATQKAVPKILEFSELGELIHMPVKNYSSGMLVRLGFSIATTLTAPVLLLDEVLGVGDALFQQKSLRKIHELHNEGRTVLLITHDPSAVVEHCSRCIVIADHKVIFDGDPERGKNAYLASLSAGSH